MPVPVHALRLLGSIGFGSGLFRNHLHEYFCVCFGVSCNLPNTVKQEFCHDAVVYLMGRAYFLAFFAVGLEVDRMAEVFRAREYMENCTFAPSVIIAAVTVVGNPYPVRLGVCCPVGFMICRLVISLRSATPRSPVRTAGISPGLSSWRLPHLRSSEPCPPGL